MAKPDIILIGGHAYCGRDSCQLRRPQLEAWNAVQPRQIALFELKDDCLRRERTAASRYAEPTFFKDMSARQ